MDIKITSNSDVIELTETRSFVCWISVIQAGYVTSLAVIADNAFGCAKTLARFARALRALIVTGTSCNSQIIKVTQLHSFRSVTVAQMILNYT